MVLNGLYINMHQISTLVQQWDVHHSEYLSGRKASVLPNFFIIFLSWFVSVYRNIVNILFGHVWIWVQGTFWRYQTFFNSKMRPTSSWGYRLNQKKCWHVCSCTKKISTSPVQNWFLIYVAVFCSVDHNWLAYCMKLSLKVDYSPTLLKPGR